MRPIVRRVTPSFSSSRFVFPDLLASQFKFQLRSLKSLLRIPQANDFHLRGVLTLTGVVLTAIQLLRKSGRFNLTLAATLPGLVLVGLGVILLT
jgi:hypothetical protein